MSREDEVNDVHGISRRRFLQAGAALVPLHAVSGIATSLTRLGSASDTREPTDDLLAIGAREAVSRIRSGDLSAEAYVTRLLEHYRAHQDLNVASAIDATRVLDAARAVDRARARGAKLPRAAGLPFAVKAQIAVAGYPTSGGNRALKGYIPKRNAEVVERLVGAGAIPFCMTSLPDMVVVDGLMHQISSYGDAYGAVHNPYDPTRVPGGSSGGSGAALAARIVPAALGLDTNGSIRCPAAFCGVVGLRPSTFTMANAIAGTNRKRYSDDGLVVPPPRRLDTIGPMARTVIDVAFLDALITGQEAPAVRLSAARIAIPAASYWDRDDIDPSVAEVVRQAFAKLRDAGCTLVEIDLDGEVRSIVGSAFRPTPASVFAGSGMNAREPTSVTIAAWLRENAPTVTLERVYGDRPIRDGKPSTLPTPAEQIRALEEAEHRYADVFRAHGVQVIAFPTVPIVAPPLPPGGPKEPLGALVSIKGKQIEEGRVIVENLFMAPRLGVPALSIPAGLSQGLPVGIELDALPGKDSELLGLGIEVQAAIGRIPAPAFS